MGTSSRSHAKFAIAIVGLAFIGALVGAAVGDASYPTNDDFTGDVLVTRGEYEWIGGIIGFVRGASLGLVVWVGWLLQRWLAGRRSHPRSVHLIRHRRGGWPPRGEVG
jgi:hypothetical protein